MARQATGKQVQIGKILGVPARPALPGQDPDRVEVILRLLVDELQPSGAIEQLWLADIAYLTARIEYFRAGLRGYYSNLQRAELNRFTISTDQGSPLDYQEKENLRKLQSVESQPNSGETHLDSPAFTRLLGEIISENLESLARLDDVEQRLLRERDRMIAQFERRRRDKVQSAITNIEASAPALPSPSQD